LCLLFRIVALKIVALHLKIFACSLGLLPLRIVALLFRAGINDDSRKGFSLTAFIIRLKPEVLFFAFHNPHPKG
jgi:hypothetical protein